MKFEHTVIIDAPRDAVWAILSDFPRAASLVPDAGELRQSDDGGYEGTMSVRVGPIGLKLSGTVHVDQDYDQGTWSIKAGAPGQSYRRGLPGPSRCHAERAKRGDLRAKRQGGHPANGSIGPAGATPNKAQGRVDDTAVRRKSESRGISKRVISSSRR